MAHVSDREHALKRVAERDAYLTESEPGPPEASVDAASRHCPRVERFTRPPRASFARPEVGCTRPRPSSRRAAFARCGRHAAHDFGRVGRGKHLLERKDATLREEFFVSACCLLRRFEDRRRQAPVAESIVRRVIGLEVLDAVAPAVEARPLRDRVLPEPCGPAMTSGIRFIRPRRAPLRCVPPQDLIELSLLFGMLRAEVVADVRHELGV
jgi:hypothetical protein